MKKRAPKWAVLLSVGDTVYCAHNGKPMVVTAMYDDGFDTNEDFFLYEEVRELFFLTEAGFRTRERRE